MEVPLSTSLLTCGLASQQWRKFLTMTLALRPVIITFSLVRPAINYRHTGAARAAVENLSKSLAVEWSSDEIRINNVAPVGCTAVEVIVLDLM